MAGDLHVVKLSTVDVAVDEGVAVVAACTRCRDVLKSILDVVLDEGLLLGPSPLAAESLRPLACQVCVRGGLACALAQACAFSHRGVLCDMSARALGACKRALGPPCELLAVRACALHTCTRQADERHRRNRAAGLNCFVLSGAWAFASVHHAGGARLGGGSAAMWGW